MQIPGILGGGRGRRRRTLDDVGQVVSLIGPETRFRGQLEGSGNTVVNGTFEGDCEIDGVVILSEAGVWVGNITAAVAIVAGEVRGDITVREKLELAPTARVAGRITAPVLAMAEGAVHQGEIRMEPAGQIHRFTERREQGRTQPGGADAPR